MNDNESITCEELEVKSNRIVFMTGTEDIEGSVKQIVLTLKSWSKQNE